MLHRSMAGFVMALRTTCMLTTHVSPNELIKKCSWEQLLRLSSICRRLAPQVFHACLLQVRALSPRSQRSRCLRLDLFCPREIVDRGWGTMSQLASWLLFWARRDVAGTMSCNLGTASVLTHAAQTIERSVRCVVCYAHAI